VVVLRHGEAVADRPTNGLSGRDLVGLITGANVELRGV
jgi:hypothetical protein